MDWEEAIEQIDGTLELIQDLEDDYPRIWDNGEDFFTDVREKMTEVRETIEENERVTMGQARAIENWGEGVRKWHPDFKD